MLDRCIRWEEGEVIPDKETDTILAAFDNLWFKRHGPPSELIVDGERGIAASEKMGIYLARLGIKLHVKGKDQHAHYIERRGALLRDFVHRLKSQLEEEGLGDTPLKMIIAEALFVTNAMITVKTGDVSFTPYQGLYGRTPKILPSIDQIDAPRGGQSPETRTIESTNKMLRRATK